MAGTTAADHRPSIQHLQPQDGKVFNSYGSMSSLSGLSNSSSGWNEERRKSKGAPNRWRPSVFDFKADRSASVCPTCKGAGRVPKGQEKELVALIPYNDKRLKPPRTCLYVVLVATLLVVSGGIIAAFLYPRSVTVDILLLNTSVDQLSYGSSNFTCPQNVTNEALVLEVKTMVRMRNSNFFPVTVDVLNVTLTNYAGMQVGVGTKATFTIDSRSHKNVTVPQNATFTNKQAQRVHTICCSGKKWSPNMYMSASVVAEYVYLSQRSTSLNQYGSDVNCQNLVAISNATTMFPPIDEFT